MGGNGPSFGWRMLYPLSYKEPRLAAPRQDSNLRQAVSK